MTADHRAEAERLAARLRASQAKYGGAILSEADVTLVLATLADRCPDPAAHQAEDTGGHLIDWAIQVVTRNGYEAIPASARKIELEELAEARAARPAPMPPEVVAVVEAAEDWATNARRAREHLSHTGTALLAKVDALPEGWRDGAAPAECPTPHHHPLSKCSICCPASAAVPAELDPAGVGRAARALYESIPEELRADWNETVAANYRRRVSAVVHAYLGDTDTGSEG